MQKHKKLMFDFVDITWSPIRVRKCPYNCYNGNCWAMRLRRGKLRKAYDDFFASLQAANPNMNMDKVVVFIPKPKPFKAGQVVFVQTMSDLFAAEVSDQFIEQIMDIIRANPQTTFLLMTKNPQRYLDLMAVNPTLWRMLQEGKPDSEIPMTFFPKNVIFGVTIETNRNYPALSKAPIQQARIEAAKELTNYDRRVVISVEPVLEFDFAEFVDALKEIRPERVAVGFDNYNIGLPEPSVAKTVRLIHELETFTKVSRKYLKGYEEP